jgi:hypothetical protein
MLYLATGVGYKYGFYFYAVFSRIKNIIML